MRTIPASAKRAGTRQSATTRAVFTAFLTLLTAGCGRSSSDFLAPGRYDITGNRENGCRSEVRGRASRREPNLARQHPALGPTVRAALRPAALDHPARSQRRNDLLRAETRNARDRYRRSRQHKKTLDDSGKWITSLLQRRRPVDDQRVRPVDLPHPPAPIGATIS